MQTPSCLLASCIFVSFISCSLHSLFDLYLNPQALASFNKMALGKRFAELTGLNITNIIHNVVEAVAEKAAYGLEDSQHAPKNGNRDTHPGICQVSSLIPLGIHYLLNSPHASCSQTQTNKTDSRTQPLNRLPAEKIITLAFLLLPLSQPLPFHTYHTTAPLVPLQR